MAKKRGKMKDEKMMKEVDVFAFNSFVQTHLTRGWILKFSKLRRFLLGFDANLDENRFYKWF